MAAPVNKIRRVGGPGQGAYTYYPVVIIGGGESGIAMGCRLRQVLGLDQFRIFERQSAIGGTWHANRYPGIACDIMAMVYSFSFCQNPKWTTLFPSGDEIVRYLYDVCAKFEILDKIQLNTSVTDVRWIDADQEWEVSLAYLAAGMGDLSTAEREAIVDSRGPAAVVVGTETIRAKVVCSAVGGLVEPKAPIDIPGIESFEGPVVHTARWDPTISLRDKSVIVIGTGCSAAQIVPQLIRPEFGAKKVTQLLRSPPWVVPFLPPEVTVQWKKWMPRLCTYVPFFQNTARKLLMLTFELEFIALFGNSERAQVARKAKAKQLLAHLHKVVPAKYHELLTPNYEVFCKRRVIDEGWFDAFNDPRVDLSSQPLTAASAKSVTLGPGRHYPPLSDTASTAPTAAREVEADVIVMANGYQTGEWLHPLAVHGRGGKSLHDVWAERGGAQAYLGTAMDGFPNFFLLFGPNTATGHTSVILASENMVDHALKFIGPIMAGDVSTWEVKESAERKWTEDLQRDLKNTVWMAGGCRSWYVDKGGWNSTVYPRSQIEFTLRYMFPNWSHWDAAYTRKGLLKMRLARILKVFSALSAVAGLLYTIRYGTAHTKQGIGAVMANLKEVLTKGVESVKGRL